MAALSFIVIGSRIFMKVALHKTPLQIDTEMVTSSNVALPAYGFALTDASGNAVSITVTIAGEDRISIVASEPVLTGFTLTYGGPSVFGGGNIRDNDGALHTVEINGSPYPLHNWMKLFSHTF